MRKFLTDIKIVGTMLVSRSGVILEYSIPNLMKWCDWVLIMFDNENEETREVVNRLKNKYKDRIRIANSGFSRATEEQEKDPRGLFHRFKPLQGPIRETVFQYMRDVENSGEKVDILIFPDSDEIFSDSLPKLLQEFWEMKEKRAITMKPVDVFGDLMTINNRSMTGHTRIMKFSHDLTALPYRTACYYRPLTKQDRIGSTKVLIHLAGLTREKRKWRNNHWKPNAKESEPLWRLPKMIYEMSPDEIKAELSRDPDMTIEDYLRGGDKRKPMGVENAKKALIEASKFLDSKNVRHYLAFGTCLGIIRNGTILKYDWDNDLIIDADDLSKINVKEIEQAGFYNIKIKKDLPNSMEDGKEGRELTVRTISFKKYGVRIDLDPIYEDVNGKDGVILKGRKRRKFCARHPLSWFKNAKVVNFEGKEFLVPNPVGDYLASNYGSDWSVEKYGPVPWERRACMSKNYAIRGKK